MSGDIWFALLLTLLAGLSTGIGSGLAYFIREPKPRFMTLILGFSAGVMLYVSFAELLHTAFDQIGYLTSNIAFFIGIASIGLIDMIVPHEYKQEHASDAALSLNKDSIGLKGHGHHGFRHGTPKYKNLKRAGMLTAIGIAIHNFPEGMAVFSSGITGDHAFGILVAVAIALHNIPEGISVSMPIFEATGNRRQAFLYSFSAGLAEPIGAIIGYTILFNFLTPTVIYALLAFAAGIMVYISLDELLPTAHQYGEEHLVIIGVVAGMAIMALSIFLLM